MKNSRKRKQTTNLLQEFGWRPKQVVVDPWLPGRRRPQPRGRDHSSGPLQVFVQAAKALLKRRQSIEPLIGATRNPTTVVNAAGAGEALGNASQALSCVADCNIRWLMRAIARLGTGDANSALLPAWRRVTLCNRDEGEP